MPEWLDRVNYYRGLANLPVVSDEPLGAEKLRMAATVSFLQCRTAPTLENAIVQALRTLYHTVE